MPYQIVQNRQQNKTTELEKPCKLVYFHLFQINARTWPFHIAMFCPITRHHFQTTWNIIHKKKQNLRLTHSLHLWTLIVHRNFNHLCVFYTPQPAMAHAYHARSFVTELERPAFLLCKALVSDGQIRLIAIDSLHLGTELNAWIHVLLVSPQL